MRYQLVRTSPYLGGQIRWDIPLHSHYENGEHKLRTDGLYICPLNDDIPFLHDNSRDCLKYAHEVNIKDLYSKIGENMWLARGEWSGKGWLHTPSGDLVDPYSHVYTMGTRRIRFQRYNKQFSFLCPLWISEETDPSKLYFVISVGVAGEERTHIVRNVMKLGDDIAGYMKNYLDKSATWITPDMAQAESVIKQYRGVNDNLLNIKFDPDQAYITGVDVRNGQFLVKDVSYIVPNILRREDPLMEFDNMLLSLFSSQHMVAQQLINLNFVFDLEDISYILKDALLGKSVTVSIRVGYDGKILPLKDIYTDYAHIPVFRADMGEFHRGNSVLDYMSDNYMTLYVHTNKFIQPIFHWTMVENPQYIYNFYDGFAPVFMDQDTKELQRVSGRYFDQADISAPDHTTYNSAAYWCTWKDMSNVRPDFLWEQFRMDTKGLADFTQFSQLILNKDTMIAYLNNNRFNMNNMDQELVERMLKYADGRKIRIANFMMPMISDSGDEEFWGANKSRLKKYNEELTRTIQDGEVYEEYSLGENEPTMGLVHRWVYIHHVAGEEDEYMALYDLSMPHELSEEWIKLSENEEDTWYKHVELLNPDEVPGEENKYSKGSYKAYDAKVGSITKDAAPLVDAQEDASMVYRTGNVWEDKKITGTPQPVNIHTLNQWSSEAQIYKAQLLSRKSYYENEKLGLEDKISAYGAARTNLREELATKYATHWDNWGVNNEEAQTIPLKIQMTPEGEFEDYVWNGSSTNIKIQPVQLDSNGNPIPSDEYTWDGDGVIDVVTYNPNDDNMLKYMLDDIYSRYPVDEEVEPTGTTPEDILIRDHSDSGDYNKYLLIKEIIECENEIDRYDVLIEWMGKDTDGDDYPTGDWYEEETHTSNLNMYMATENINTMNELVDDVNLYLDNLAVVIEEVKNEAKTCTTIMECFRRDALLALGDTNTYVNSLTNTLKVIVTDMAKSQLENKEDLMLAFVQPNIGNATLYQFAAWIKAKGRPGIEWLINENLSDTYTKLPAGDPYDYSDIWYTVIEFIGALHDAWIEPYRITFDRSVSISGIDVTIDGDKPKEVIPYKDDDYHNEIYRYTGRLMPLFIDPDSDSFRNYAFHYKQWTDVNSDEVQKYNRQLMSGFEPDYPSISFFGLEEERDMMEAPAWYEKNKWPWEVYWKNGGKVFELPDVYVASTEPMEGVKNYDESVEELMWALLYKYIADIMKDYSRGVVVNEDGEVELTTWMKHKMKELYRIQYNFEYESETSLRVVYTAKFTLR